MLVTFFVIIKRVFKKSYEISDDFIDYDNDDALVGDGNYPDIIDDIELEMQNKKYKIQKSKAAHPFITSILFCNEKFIQKQCGETRNWNF